MIPASVQRDQGQSVGYKRALHFCELLVGRVRRDRASSGQLQAGESLLSGEGDVGGRIAAVDAQFRLPMSSGGAGRSYRDRGLENRAARRVSAGA